MTDGEGRRVALLARPGAACDRLREALEAAGAQRVLEADPSGLQPDQLTASSPQVVVVALDSVTEEALDRFDDVLGDPAIDVIFEEAELAAAREGWDAARWQRHLVAKLHGNRSVLPPGPAGDAGSAAAELARVDAADAALADALATAAVEMAAPADAASPDQSPASEPAAPSNPFDPVSAEFSDYEPAPGDDFELATIGHDNAAAAAPAPSSEFESGFDATLGEAAADAFAPIEHGGSAAEAAGDGTGPASGVGGFGELRLDDGGESHGAVDTEETAHRFHRDLVDLEERISGLELVHDTPQRGPEQARGAVLVLAGLGGPDAVRQLLGALPVGFARPVLVQQRLDGGRYDKLVAQMQRATALPVALAESGTVAEAGTIYILPASMGLDSGDGLRFEEGGGDVLAALPAADSAVLLLSGCEPDVVDTIMNHNWSGAVVAGQAADGCYDPAAANAMAARGGETGQPAELALRLVDRWPADKS